MHHQCLKIILVQNFDQSKDVYIYICISKDVVVLAQIAILKQQCHFCECRSRFPMELCMGTQHPTELSNGTASLQHQLEHPIVYWELVQAHPKIT